MNLSNDVLIYILAICILTCIYFSMPHNYRHGVEHGSAKWGKPSILNKKYEQRPKENNKILSNDMSIGFDTHRHGRNLNVLVVGGSGSGKTRFYAKPNIMQANSSYVVMDPKGEILRSEGELLKKKGYDIKVLDLIDMEKSHGYNPFKYLHSDIDVTKLCTNLFKSTQPKNNSTSDPFWDLAATELLTALVSYLVYEAPEEEQNFSMVLEMLRAGAEDEDSGLKSALDLLFDDLEMKDPYHQALKHYRDYKLAKEKTASSIQMTLVARLGKFNLKQMAELTNYDEMELETVGDKKTAIFAITPDNDTSINFIVSMLYTQLFQELFYKADRVYNGELPVHVHLVMDEFANVCLPDDFEKILSVMRSRGISASIIIQNMAQLKALFKDQWESITGNCDTLLYLGGNEQSTHEYISKLLGKETIDTNSFGKSNGRNGHYSTNYQVAGRELMTPDEVRRLDNRFALLFIKGERPVKTMKYVINRHPNFNLTLDGKGSGYEHGLVNNAVMSIKIESIMEEKENEK